MKTVSGTIVSSKPVSLSKAANILSSFVNSENGASQSVSTYLRRTSAAFNELVYLKKHHKHKKHRTIEEGSSKSDINPRRNSEEDEVRVLENTKFDHDPVDEKENGNFEGKLEKKKKKKKKDKGSLAKSEEDNEIVKGNSEEKKRKNEEVEEDEISNSKKKKRKNEEVEEDEISNSKKKKRRRTEAAADNE